MVTFRRGASGVQQRLLGGGRLESYGVGKGDHGLGAEDQHEGAGDDVRIEAE